MGSRPEMTCLALKAQQVSERPDHPLGPRACPDGGLRCRYLHDTVISPKTRGPGSRADRLVQRRMRSSARIMNHHTSPEDVGRVFTESGARLAVYSHVIVAGYADSESGLSELPRSGGLEPHTPGS